MKGHVRERPPGSGNWYAVIDTREAATGKRKRKWVRVDASGKRQAQNECARLVSEMAAGRIVEPEKMKLAAFLEHWLEAIRANVSARTFERYGDLVRKNLIPALGETVVTKLEPHQISAFYSAALRDGRRDGKGGLSPRTVHHIHRVLNQALAWGVRMGLPKGLHVNPAARLGKTDRPKIERKALQTYDLAQTVQLLDVMRPKRIFVPMMLAVLCGLRRGEIAALRWRNVDLKAGSLAVVESAEQTDSGVRYKEPKSGRARLVSLSPTVIEELTAWRVKQAQEFLRLGTRPTAETFVVTQETGHPLQPRSLTHEWVRLIAETDLPRVRFHDLRHAHATHMLAAGVHPKIASERLGHSKVGITLDLYSHVMPGMQDEAAAKVDAALKAAQKR